MTEAMEALSWAVKSAEFFVSKRSARVMKFVGAVIDGCLPGIHLDVTRIQQELARRRPGQSELTSPRNEQDQVRIVSGVFEGKTLGTPITLTVDNKDARISDYAAMKDRYRPSHADYVYMAKYGIRAWRVEDARLLEKPSAASQLVQSHDRF